MNYRGYQVNYLIPSGMFEAYIEGRFIKADCTNRIKFLIDQDIEKNRPRKA